MSASGPSQTTHSWDTAAGSATGVAGTYPGLLTCADTPTARPWTCTAAIGRTVGRPALVILRRTWAGDAFEPTERTGVRWLKGGAPASRRKRSSGVSGPVKSALRVRPARRTG